jgi:transcriptional regulator with PAS, ATPase and Fis domain
LVVGPTGTGKELLTQLYAHTWIGNLRRDRYHPLNCTGFAEELLSAQLFGYIKGAFTGADPKGAEGLVEANDLICLDELGDASARFQAQVLRVVEYGTYTKLGETSPRKTDCKFIGSTNNLGGIRRDLAFRFHVVHISPLILRGEDFAVLVEDFVNRRSQRSGNR